MIGVDDDSLGRAVLNALEYLARKPAEAWAAAAAARWPTSAARALRRQGRREQHRWQTTGASGRTSATHSEADADANGVIWSTRTGNSQMVVTKLKVRLWNLP